LAVALFLPPVALVFAALLGLLLEHRHRRLGRVLMWAGALGLLVLATPPVANALLFSLEGNLPLAPPPDRPPQAIVVLGGDNLSYGGPDAPDELGPLSLERDRAAAALYRKTGLPILVTGGRVRAREVPIADLMADSLRRDFQVPVRWTEREARDTWENAHLSAAILRLQGIDSIYLVTHAWHMPRAILSFAGTGITITAAPTRMDRAPPLGLRDLIPSPYAWRQSYFALHEWVGLAWYSVR
jgi:uncharacterized SAM-binding protein YcdF (DUF218 family)